MYNRTSSNRRSHFTVKSGALLIGLASLTSALTSCIADEPKRTATRSRPTSRPVQQARLPEARPTTKAPWVYAKSVIVLDANNGRTLYSKAADTRRAVASTQKLMTALLTIERGNLDQSITVAKSDTWAEPSKLYLKAGHRYTRRQILGPMLVKSGNDAARFLARTHSGSEANFGRAMTARAKQLGMHNTNFVNASGLTAGGQYSTARDMGKLAMKAYSSSAIRYYSRLQQISFRYADGKTTTFKATNKLLSKSPYCNGLKTGYTRAAGRCLVSSGTYKGRNVVVVVLGSNSKYIWSDSRSLLHWALGAP